MALKSFQAISVSCQRVLLSSMKSRTLNVFEKLRRQHLSLLEWQVLWQLLDTVGLSFLPSFLMAARPDGARGPERSCLTPMTEDIVRYMPGSSFQTPLCTREQLAPHRITYAGHRTLPPSQRYNLAWVRFQLVSWGRELISTHEGTNI